MPSVVTGPRHRRDNDTMVTTPNPRCVRLDEHPGRACVQRPPPPATFTVVIARRAPLAATTPATSPSHRPNRDHNHVARLVELDILHHGARKPTRPRPYAGSPHPVLLPRFKPSDSSKPKKQTGCARGHPHTRPTDTTGERL